MPTLCIHGTADKTVPIDATGREVAKAVPGARLIEYDGSAHGLFATDKDRLCDDLDRLPWRRHGAHRRGGRAAQRDPAQPELAPDRSRIAGRAKACYPGRHDRIAPRHDRRPADRRLPDRDPHPPLRLPYIVGLVVGGIGIACCPTRRSCRCRATSSSTSSCRLWCSRRRFSSNGSASAASFR